MTELRFTANTLLQDNETRLLIPSNEVIFGGLLAGGLTQILNNINLDAATTKRGVVENILQATLSGPLLTLGVTDIRIRGKMVLPRTKGIGAVGQIIHLMGSENEKLTLKFTTDRFPGAMSAILRKLIKITLEQADMVYVVDDLLAVAPCILIDYDLQKVGQLKSAIVGELKLEVLNTGSNFGLKAMTFTFLSTLGLSAINNTISDLSQPFKWMGEFVKSKSSR